MSRSEVPFDTSDIAAQADLAARYSGGGDPGPYASSLEAFRHSVRNTFPCPHHGSLGEYLGWPSVLITTPILDPQNANGKRTTLRCDPYIQDGDLLGFSEPFDEVSQAPLGFVDPGQPAPPAKDGMRDNGFFSRLGGASSPSVPRVIIPGLHQGLDQHTWFAQLRTFVGSQGTLTPVMGQVLNYATGAGFRIRLNKNRLVVSFGSAIGPTRGVSTFTGPNILLTPLTTYIVAWAVDRDLGTANGGTLRLRIWDSTGAVLITDKRAYNATGPFDAAAANVFIAKADWVKSYPGVNLLGEPAAPGALPIADAVADGTNDNPGGALDMHLSGIKTGVIDPANPSRLIHQVNPVLRPRAWPRRSRRRQFEQDLP